MNVTSLDAAPANSGDTDQGWISASVSATGDVHGLADLLRHIHTGAQLMEIRELDVRPNPALRGELLQVQIVVRAPYRGS
jgi:hypothetical protein